MKCGDQIFKSRQNRSHINKTHLNFYELNKIGYIDIRGFNKKYMGAQGQFGVSVENVIIDIPLNTLIIYIH